jgi:hypothetical protein
MKFMPIFTEPEYCDLWSTCYPEHEINEEIKDIYSILMDDKWSDDKYLLEFIKQNEECLNDNYWVGVDMF